MENVNMSVLNYIMKDVNLSVARLIGYQYPAINRRGEGL